MKKRILAFSFQLSALIVLSGCAGTVMSSNLSAQVDANAANADTLRPQAQAGLLSADESLACIVNGGEEFSACWSQQTSNYFSHAFTPGKGLLFTDAHYPAAFAELAANAISRQHAATSKWAASQPSKEYLNAAAAQSLRELVIAKEFETATVNHVSTASLKAMKAPKKLKAVPVQSLADLVASKMPKGWIDAYNKLPQAVRDQVNADLPVVAAWAADQLQAWWDNYLAGDTVAARVLVLDSLPDDQRVIVGQQAADNAEAVINRHVDTNVAALTGARNLAMAFIPALLGLLGV